MVPSLPSLPSSTTQKHGPSKSNLYYFINEPSNLFLVETSYIYRPEDNTFVIILHIPQVAKHNHPLSLCYNTVIATEMFQWSVPQDIKLARFIEDFIKTLVSKKSKFTTEDDIVQHMDITRNKSLIK
jgi:hypothetical protein